MQKSTVLISATVASLAVVGIIVVIAALSDTPNMNQKPIGATNQYPLGAARFPTETHLNNLGTEYCLNADEMFKCIASIAENIVFLVAAPELEAAEVGTELADVGLDVANLLAGFGMGDADLVGDALGDFAWKIISKSAEESKAAEDAGDVAKDTEDYTKLIKGLDKLKSNVDEGKSASGLAACADLSTSYILREKCPHVTHQCKGSEAISKSAAKDASKGNTACYCKTSICAFCTGDGTMLDNGKKTKGALPLTCANTDFGAGVQPAYKYPGPGKPVLNNQGKKVPEAGLGCECGEGSGDPDNCCKQCTGNECGGIIGPNQTPRMNTGWACGNYAHVTSCFGKTPICCTNDTGKPICCPEGSKCISHDLGDNQCA